ncbi:hypothetical protein PGT21_028980 [Puccinia graminis f. sp. tritici]|uniref:Uncharacterized protein n=1 Tax=Puccinia graminis f. sp. tritici TaxID=56615 RepID=A0A5B0MXM5_PUCGR|nr:hypothetical protein PGT21_028980 [Puccinia graminis f. sp. tritici]
MSAVDMYVAEGSLPHQVDPTLTRLTSLVESLVARLDNLERAVAAKPAPPAQTQRQDSFNTLLVRFEEIASNLSRLEKKVEDLSSSNGPAAAAATVLPPKSISNGPGGS